MSIPMSYDDSVCESQEPLSLTSRPTQDQIKKKRKELIKSLSPFLHPSGNIYNSSTPSKPNTSTSSAPEPKVIDKHEKLICNVNLILPVKPYPCQMAVISKVLKSIKESKNCLVESPTGTGKTLALLCAALAWQQQEKKRLIKEKEDDAYKRNPDLKKAQNTTLGHVASPEKNMTESEIQFGKPIHGERSIYDVSIEECSFSYAVKPKEMLDSCCGSDGLVGITKKVRDPEASSSFYSDLNETKNQTTDNDVTSEAIRNQMLLNNLQEQVSMIVDSSLPVIYYGARTHKQLEQVVQEFARTEYAKVSPMTILSSRDVSCIREFDKTIWPSKNDMCQSCVKSSSGSADTEPKCLYYTNYKSLNHRTLPPAFDVKKLISEGKKVIACPYYAARKMGKVAQIVFCPYNYLIEPSIRRNMQIDIRDNIVIIDEAHNIEDVCRESASFTFKRLEIENAVKELNTAMGFRFVNQDGFKYMSYLSTALIDWSYWFSNQKQLIEKQPVNDGEAEYVWEMNNFLGTLDNHNIGPRNYLDFSNNAKMFCRKLRDDPRLLVGVTQATGTLIENLDTVFGYLYRNACQSIEDYKAVMVRKLLKPFTGRSKSHFDMVSKSECLSVSLVCLNPGVVFSSLQSARCVLLASGTLTPMSSLHSELETVFPNTVNPNNHVLKEDRVWVGSVGGRMLQCDSSGTSSPAVQDELGRVLHHVCDVTPHGVLCFLPSYHVMKLLYDRWRFTEMWDKLNVLKEVFREGKGKDHEIVMSKYYKCVQKPRGALLLAVYRGKVAEGMDFKDHQARAVVAVGVPYPAQFKEVKEKMKYNDKYAKHRNLLTGKEWLKVQAYRALNQAAGRVVRHAGDWGAVLLVDSRYRDHDYCCHLSNWLKDRLGNNHNDFETFYKEENGLKRFMTKMKNEEK